MNHLNPYSKVMRKAAQNVEAIRKASRQAKLDAKRGVSYHCRYIPYILLMRKNSFPMFTEDNARQTEAIFKQRKVPNIFL